SMVQEGTDFSDLMVVPGIRLSEELYAVGFRENSPETVEKVNQALKELVEDGTVARLADKYPTVLVCLEGVE
ncbi:MAG: transporter substrate-binding domain-containing protein, partial [Candidatus Fournierella pullistercoris]|nr:transporter substrate-binding domain-containing protein [Candidatus Fournierella pullistercoris]